MTIESNAMVAWFGIQHSQWKYDINKNEKALGHQKNTNLIKISSRPFYISFQYVSVFFAVGGRRRWWGRVRGGWGRAAVQLPGLHQALHVS